MASWSVHIPSREGRGRNIPRVASCYRNQDMFQLDHMVHLAHIHTCQPRKFEKQETLL